MSKCKDCHKCLIAVLLYEAGAKLSEIKKLCKKARRKNADN